VKKFFIAAVVAVFGSVAFAGGEVAGQGYVNYPPAYYAPAPIPAPAYQAYGVREQSESILSVVGRYAVDRVNDVVDVGAGAVDAVVGLVTLDPSVDDGRPFFQGVR